MTISGEFSKHPLLEGSARVTRPTVKPQPKNASERLPEIISRNRRSEQVGVYAVCSAHPSVIAAAVQQAVEDESVLHVESTSSQVNHLGGYTGQTPSQFAKFVQSAAQHAGLPRDRVLLGGDHLGPYPWREQPLEVALHNACELVRSCVLAGYKKIHLDASMACADDATSGPDQRTIAQRAAILCRAAESAFEELPHGSVPSALRHRYRGSGAGGESLPGRTPSIIRPTRFLTPWNFSARPSPSRMSWQRGTG